MTTISRSIKKIWIQLLILGLNGLTFLLKSFLIIIKKVIIKPLSIIGKIFYNILIIPLYKQTVTLTKLVNRIIGPVKNKYLLPFINRYVTHSIIIGLTIAIVFLNYQVKETRAESFGERSILYSIVKGGDLDDMYIEETVHASMQSDASVSYFEDEFSATSPTSEIISPANPLVDSNVSNTELTITEGGAVAPTEVASIEASKKTRDKVINYEVKGGDTVSGIAANFGLSTNTLLWANNMSYGSYLKPGQNLDIPPVDGIIYTVKNGDTLGSIAKKYEGDSDKIVSFNKLSDSSDIIIGQTLMIPGGRPYQAPAPIQTAKIAPVSKIFAARGTAPGEQGGSSLIWPTTTRRISQYYSWRHTALDIDGEFGDLIWTSGTGTVSRVQYLNYGYGYNVIIDHGNGTQTLYAHFQKIYVKPGEAVTQGQALGEMGSTGRSTGSHLHFEVRRNGQLLNPFSWVSG